MKLTTLSGKDVDTTQVYLYGIYDRPAPKHRRAIPRDEIQMDSYYEENAELTGIKNVVDLNPGCQLYVMYYGNSTGFWVPVQFNDED